MNEKEQRIAFENNFHALVKHIEQNEFIYEVINTSDELKIPNWFVGAGCIAQTVWNNLSNRDPSDGIKDIDWVYYDKSDLSEEAEIKISEMVKHKFKHIPIKFDVKNQARVHAWYEQKFGYRIEPYMSIESAIDTWPTTSTTIALKKIEGKLVYYSSFGLGDLLDMVTRANKRQVTKEIYENKVLRWKRNWPNLRIIPWDE